MSSNNLTEVSFPHDVSNLNFEGSFFTKSNLYSTKANHTIFSNANFVYSFSTNSEFRNSNFIDAHLNYSKFSESSFDNADFTNANLRNANFANTNLYNSNITTQQLKSLKSYKCAILPNGDLFDNDGQYDCHLTNLDFYAENKKIKQFQIQIIQPLHNKMGSEKDLNNFLKTKECTNCDL